MSREWKPGDVAMIKAHIGDQGTRVVRGFDDRWHGEAGIYRLFTDARPLVVIDPEDREAVERLWQMAVSPLPVFTAALRELADPKPKEPTDPKTRVTDRRDNIWRLLADGEWICVDGPDLGTYVTWARLLDDFAPLEVLSEGVQ